MLKIRKVLFLVYDYVFEQKSGDVHRASECYKKMGVCFQVHDGECRHIDYD